VEMGPDLSGGRRRWKSVEGRRREGGYLLKSLLVGGSQSTNDFSQR
jgi:hypothetical protein